jgi:hypothetical protein
MLVSPQFVVGDYIFTQKKKAHQYNLLICTRFELPAALKSQTKAKALVT